MDPNMDSFAVRYGMYEQIPDIGFWKHTEMLNSVHLLRAGCFSLLLVPWLDETSHPKLPLISMDVHGHPWILMDMHGNRMYSHGYP